MLPRRLSEDIENLAARGWTCQVIEEPAFIAVVVQDVPTGAAFRPAATDILLRVPRAYPEGAPDMFWTLPDVALSDGGVPKGAEVLESHIGRLWRRFSWHRRNAWNPSTDWLGTHLEFVRQRFRAP